jgi:hypothetical protein
MVSAWMKTTKTINQKGIDPALSRIDPMMK